MAEFINSRILVAGAQGMVGSALVRGLQDQGCANILKPTRQELDYTNRESVEKWFAKNRPEVVLFAAARVGGIHANNTYPATFIFENLSMAVNTIDVAYQSGADRFLYLGSTCIYPRISPQPMPESCLLTGPLEPTNEAYAIAKIAGLKMCQFYRQQHGVTFHSAMPTNLYGPGDNYHPKNSHVLPALIRRIHEAHENGDPEVVVWGTGEPRREFLHVDDLAAGVIHLMSVDDPPDWVNVGTGQDISIRELALLIGEIIGYSGNFVFDTSKPDGTPRKQSDIRLIQSTGWSPKIDLRSGIAQTYRAFLTETTTRELREV